ncbi:hypothetical protein M885DRAFT_569365 [Pelagophyceae sp. CCMP2097]|nr:hypothetical protein M885DRAFT_569365 [Pelagophyceae sp. CCMP2097]
MRARARAPSTPPEPGNAPDPWIRRIYVTQDNCGATNKSQYALGFYALQAVLGLYDVYEIAFQVAGHTKFAPGVVASKLGSASNCSERLTMVLSAAFYHFMVAARENGKSEDVTAHLLHLSLLEQDIEKEGSTSRGVVWALVQSAGNNMIDVIGLRDVKPKCEQRLVCGSKPPRSSALIALRTSAALFGVPMERIFDHHSVAAFKAWTLLVRPGDAAAPGAADEVCDNNNKRKSSNDAQPVLGASYLESAKAAAALDDPVMDAHMGRVDGVDGVFDNHLSSADMPLAAPAADAFPAVSRAVKLKLSTFDAAEASQRDFERHLSLLESSFASRKPAQAVKLPTPFLAAAAGLLMLFKKELNEMDRDCIIATTAATEKEMNRLFDTLESFHGGVFAEFKAVILNGKRCFRKQGSSLESIMVFQFDSAADFGVFRGLWSKVKFDHELRQAAISQTDKRKAPVLCPTWAAN